MFKRGRGSIGDSVGHGTNQTCLSIDHGDQPVVLKDGARVEDRGEKGFHIMTNTHNKIQWVLGLI